MTDFYLITGFLGAGKTTLLKSLLPLFESKSIGLIVNEFGKVGLDGALLRETGAEVAQIVNGSIFCVCRLDQFEQALNEALSGTPDVILVETSGLSDPGAIRMILSGYERAGALRYRGAICLADAPRIQKLMQTARACRKQLAIADLVLINKCDLVSEEDCAAVERLIGGVSLAPCLRTSYAAMTREQLEKLTPINHAALIDQRPDITLQKETLAISPEGESRQVLRLLALLAENSYRIKGFLAVSDGRFLVDCVGADVRVTPYQGVVEHENRLTLLAGEGMPLRKALQQALREFGKLASLLRADDGC